LIAMFSQYTLVGSAALSISILVPSHHLTS
jgi:hypothetical protein